jgi:hypothetical protein
LRSRLERLIAPAFLLLIASSADDSRQAEIACQQRLVNVPANARPVKPGPGDSVTASGFARLSQGYSDLPLKGCTERQAHAAQALSKLARELAGTAGVAEQARLEGPPSIRHNQALMIFTERLEQFENRRRVMREDLARMEAEDP